MDEAKTYLIAYDIPDDRRRSRIADILLSYGRRVQESVFIVEARGAKYLRMRDAVLTILDKRRDSFIICDLGQSKSAKHRITKYGIGSDLGEEKLLVF
jgi:CRISPR-associated protein Cas2